MEFPPVGVMGDCVHPSSTPDVTMVSRSRGFEVIWSRPVRDETDEDGAHLFVLARKA